MADLGQGLKSVLLKGMEAIGKTASNIASNTKYKVDEMNLVNRRREILSDFGARAYEIWLKQEEHFPQELESLLQELAKVDDQLNAMRAERVTGVKDDTEAAADATEETEAAEEAPVKETPAEEETEVPTLDVAGEAQPAEDKKSEPLDDAIDTLLNKADKLAETAGAQLDKTMASLDEELRKAGEKLDDALKNFGDKHDSNK